MNETIATLAAPAPERWFLLIGEREHGPFGLAQLLRFRDKEMVMPGSLLRHAESGAVLPASAIAELFPSSAPAVPAEPAVVALADCPEQAVSFQTFGGKTDPVRLGKGSVRIENGELVIRGRRRRLFALRRTEEHIAERDIHDVTVEGSVLHFRCEGQKSKLPRLLVFKSPAAAQQFADCLPGRLSAEGAQARADKEEFSRFLHENGVPLFTLAVVAINLLIFVVAGFKGAGWVGGDANVLLTLGGNLAPYTTQGEWWRLMSSMFLHAGLMHVLFNMWALWDAGRIAERLFGIGRFALIYFAAGLCGSIFSINWQQELVGVGASGAVFGVYGALLAALTLRKDLLPLSVTKQMTTSMLAFIAYSLFNGFAKSGIDNAAHIGGLIAGLVLGAGMIAPPALRRLATAGLAVLLVLGAARAVSQADAVRDEPAFRVFMKTMQTEETHLNSEAQKLFAAAATTPQEEFLRRLDGEIIAGWRSLHERIKRLTHVAQRSREARELLAQFIGLKLESLEDLHAGVTQNDMQRINAGKDKLDKANALLADAKRRADERKGKP